MSSSQGDGTGRGLRAGAGPQRLPAGWHGWRRRTVPDLAGAMSAARPQFSIDDAFELSLEDAGPVPESSGVSRFGPLHFERRARFEVADEDKQSRLRYQNLENDEDGAQASPEPDGGVSIRDSCRTSIRSSQWSFSTISNSTQRSYNACCSWTQHPLIQKNRRVVLASFLLLLLGLDISQGLSGALLRKQSLVSLPGRVSAHGDLQLRWGTHHSSGLSPVGGCGWRSPPCPLLPPSPSRLHLCAVLILIGVGLEVAPSPGVSSAIFFVPGFLLLVPGGASRRRSTT
ncbi:PREDICTED: transmembrane protein 134 isoform X2 [Hipposideros armiger]|uniref:Transmembrane protein 134 isoform X2 n=1 Tax=Hipposideros armiger TaxID=186990 RepID=A0A8B7RKA0_HIPAR|nr:PREDICTED: transmembrane protein 134 isoform X2 [Hipposideros armiger]